MGNSLSVVPPPVPVVEVLDVLCQDVDVPVGRVLGPHEPVAVHLSLAVAGVLADILRMHHQRARASKGTNVGYRSWANNDTDNTLLRARWRLHVIFCSLDLVTMFLQVAWFVRQR